ncbi:thiamine biosynthetic bifunctional [Moniliophthora roreri]|nr:thiamine biosynthetic bifunctional [Moniliophthora roreri]
MPIAITRKLLPKDAIIGASCNNLEEVQKALTDGADYIGIGAVWATTTKTLDKPVVGVRNVGAMLEMLDGTRMKAVAIGGIKSTNLLRTLHGSVSRTNHALDGIAIVSEIMASNQPKEAATKLRDIIQHFRDSRSIERGLCMSDSYAVEQILDGIIHLFERMKVVNPLITNNVAIAQSANVTISIGASPIMATTAQEMSDLAKICDALLVNIGTLTHGPYEGMLQAGWDASVTSLDLIDVVLGSCMNSHRKPIVFDPVGVGATNFRKESVNGVQRCSLRYLFRLNAIFPPEILNTWQTSVIKGNAGELAALAGSAEVESRGVDSIGSGFNDPVTFVRNLARKERCIVALTGKTDYVSDGVTVAILRNGHGLLGRITGSGCITGSCIASYCAVASRSFDVDEGRLATGNMFLGTIAGILVLTIAAEIAATRGDVKGPGTFFSALLDELTLLTPEAGESRTSRALLVIDRNAPSDDGNGRAFHQDFSDWQRTFSASSGSKRLATGFLAGSSFSLFSQNPGVAVCLRPGAIPVSIRSFTASILHSDTPLILKPMPSFATTIEDFSPLLVYSADWVQGSSQSDNLVSSYSASSFFATNVTGGKASFTFNGTGIEIFGSKRNNHGGYVVQIDGTSVSTQSGQSSANQFKTSLFSQRNLENKQHTVTITNQGTNLQFLDIDFVTWYSTIGADNEQLVEPSRGDPDSDGVALYGPVGPSAAAFDVQVDNEQASAFTANKARDVPQVLLYRADGLGPGKHTVKLSCRPSGVGQACGIDYAEVYTTSSIQQSSSSGSTSSISSGAIAGLVIGILVCIGIIILGLFWYFRRRKARKQEEKFESATLPSWQTGPEFRQEGVIVNQKPPSSRGSVGLLPMPPYPEPPASIPPPSTYQSPSSNAQSSTVVLSAQSEMYSLRRESLTTDESASSSHRSHGRRMSAMSRSTSNSTSPRPSRGISMKSEVPPPLPSAAGQSLREVSEEELRANRRVVERRPQDFGSLSVGRSAGERSEEQPPPDYSQATEPYPTRI